MPSGKAIVDRAAEDFLAHRLTDRWRTISSIGYNAQRFEMPRICDLASFQLANTIGAGYRFDDPTTDRESAAECAANLNVWRARRGLPALPLPAPVGCPKEASKATLRPLLAAAAADSPARRAPALTSLKSMGLSALPAVARLADRTAVLPAGIDLSETARGLALCVREVSVSGGVAPAGLPRPGDVLTSDRINGLLKSIANLPLATLTVEREGNLGGVSVRLRLGKSAVPASEVNFGCAVRVGSYNHAVSGVSTGPLDAAIMIDSSRSDLLRVVQTAPRTPFCIYFYSNRDFRPSRPLAHVVDAPQTD